MVSAKLAQDSLGPGAYISSGDEYVSVSTGQPKPGVYISSGEEYVSVSTGQPRTRGVYF